MGIYLMDIYRSPNIGIFMKTNDRYLIVPKGLAQTKTDKISNMLQVSPVFASVAGSRLLGPLIVMNNKGLLISRLAEDEELRELRERTGMRVERLESRYTAAGNLVVANDKYALASPVLEQKAIQQIRDVLDTEVSRLSVGKYNQIGAFIVATNSGAATHPSLSEHETERISKLLGVEASPTSVNGGVPYVASGIVANSKNAVVGSLTTGPELVFITRALKV
jgi:translation initiation factor 6